MSVRMMLETTPRMETERRTLGPEEAGRLLVDWILFRAEEETEDTEELPEAEELPELCWENGRVTASRRDAYCPFCGARVPLYRKRDRNVFCPSDPPSPDGETVMNWFRRGEGRLFLRTPIPEESYRSCFVCGHRFGGPSRPLTAERENGTLRLTCPVLPGEAVRFGSCFGLDPGELEEVTEETLLFDFRGRNTAVFLARGQVTTLLELDATADRWGGEDPVYRAFRYREVRQLFRDAYAAETGVCFFAYPEEELFGLPEHLCDAVRFPGLPRPGADAVPVGTWREIEGEGQDPLAGSLLCREPATPGALRKLSESFPTRIRLAMAADPLIQTCGRPLRQMIGVLGEEAAARYLEEQPGGLILELMKELPDFCAFLGRCCTQRKSSPFWDDSDRVELALELAAEPETVLEYYLLWRSGPVGEEKMILENWMRDGMTGRPKDHLPRARIEELRRSAAGLLPAYSLSLGAGEMEPDPCCVDGYLFAGVRNTALLRRVSEQLGLDPAPPVCREGQYVAAFRDNVPALLIGICRRVVERVWPEQPEPDAFGVYLEWKKRAALSERRRIIM